MYPTPTITIFLGATLAFCFTPLLTNVISSFVVQPLGWHHTVSSRQSLRRHCLVLRIAHGGNLLLFANTTNLRVVCISSLPRCFHHHRFCPDVISSIICWNIKLHWSFIGPSYLSQHVLVLWSAVTCPWRAAGLSLCNHTSLKSSKLFLKVCQQFLTKKKFLNEGRTCSSTSYVLVNLCWFWTDTVWCVIEQVPLLYILLPHM
jgi:hypothetical protein